jgi:hypothetical protein
MLELRKQQIQKIPRLSFDEFHELICKSMPDASRYPEMYNLCYDLMKFTWETAQKSA